jgi:hypothetical protein
MKRYHPRGTCRKSAEALPDGPDLFAWAADRIALDSPAPPSSRAVRHVARRHHISPHHARTVAELAGFNLEACE